ncbi:MAG: endopeptidase La [Acidobacteriota bacterium]
MHLKVLPVLPLKNSVLFPHLLMPVSVGRPASVAAVEAALATEDKEIFIVAQRDHSVEVPEQEDVYTIGTIAVIKKIARRKDSLIDLIVQGVERAVLVRLERSKLPPTARVRPFPLPEDRSPEIEALHREVLSLFSGVISLAKLEAPIDPAQLVESTTDPLRLVYQLSTIVNIDVAKEQAVLEAQTVADALRLLHIYLTYEVQVLELREKIASQAETEISREQREYLLRQQLRAIQQELGEASPEQGEIEILRGQLKKADLPEVVDKESERELRRLERIPPGSPDYNVIRSYLELILELPWNKSSEDVLDVARSRRILDEDHYDLKEVKLRILEHLGVLKLNPEAKAPILCFVGPPGVGKTSLGQSIARALRRKFERMSLGGLHDEAELRGHRRTYIGAMPGRILQAIRRAGVKNPVLMLDEVDKLGRDFRGDPAFALLEVLDPEQNKDFRDNYLDLPFDLSRVLFITTANTLDTVPRPLLDRLEVLRLSGYSDEEKVEIAKRYLNPRQLKETGLTKELCCLTDEALRQVISRYTREAGVRQLERTIASLARKVALKFAEGRTEPLIIQAQDLDEMLGPEPFFLERVRRCLTVGVAPGLAWTESGGDVLYVEATLLPDGEGLTLTGQLGDVMQESAKTALSFVRANREELKLSAEKFRSSGVHVHVPAGAIPKDGPSAGVTIAAALVSIYAGVPLRSDTAMTGEITLTGLVLPIGGVKEKLLAARRSGIHRIILPRENKKDLRELPEEVRDQMQTVFVDNVREVLAAAIQRLPEQTNAATGRGR